MIVEIDVDESNNQAMLEDARPLTPEQQELADNFTKAMAEEGAPSPGAIAIACDVSEQAVSNWKRTGKITKRNLAIVSEMTGWSVARLLTGAEAAAREALDGESSDEHRVDHSDWMTLQAVKMLVPESDLAAYRDRHARLMAQAKQELEDAARSKTRKP